MAFGTTSSGTFYYFNNKQQSIPIVFIHGVGLDHNIWDPQIDEFDNTVLEETVSNIEKKNEFRVEKIYKIC